MIHTRKQIIENQSKFRKEIEAWLKKDFQHTKKELLEIESENPKIREEKEKLLVKLKKVSPSKEMVRLFISEKNLYPKFYVWWDEENMETTKHKYSDLV
jgi:hypothetical protein